MKYYTNKQLVFAFIVSNVFIYSGVILPLVTIVKVENLSKSTAAKKI